MFLLPHMPDEALQQTIALWAVGGAAIGFGAILVHWLVKPGVFGDVVREAPIYVPGAPKPSDPVPVPWGPAGHGRPHGVGF